MRRRGRIRAALAHLAGPLAAAVAYGLVLSGAPASLGVAQSSLFDVAVVAVLLGVLASSFADWMRFAVPSERAQQVSRWARYAQDASDARLGLALVAAVYGLLALTSGVWLSPVIYLLVAFAATFLTVPGGVLVLVAALGLEWAPYLPFRAEPSSVWDVVVRSFYLVLSYGLHAAFLRGLVARMRKEHRESLAAQVIALRQEAREFRLMASSLGAESRAQRPREEEEQKLAEGAVETIHASMFHTLELLKRCLELNTCVLLWLDLTGERLRIKELVSDSELVTETPIDAADGAIGAIVKDRLLLNLRNPKPGHIPYYANGEQLGAFLGVPVLEEGHLRGVLCADRHGDQPFSKDDELLLLGASQQILRSIQSERIFSAVERSKYEHERFYKASAMLGRALTPEQVMDTAIEAAREIVPFELASISLFDKDAKRHRVCRVFMTKEGEGLVDKSRLEGLEFRDNAGIASMVVKNKHYLPAGGELRDQGAPVYTRSVKLRGAESLLVLPLVCADEAIGTFTLASRARHAFRKDAREMLGVIANQVAVSLENAKMYRSMEQMATTDGLTGLLNHRTFQDRLADLLDRADRHGHRLSLILTDIDHFKKINDTYGHPVGDQVLRNVSAILAEMVRKIDVVARYGGEEFAIVIDGADIEGAFKLAERIRTRVAEKVFQSEKGPFRVTLSLGIAGYPHDAKDKQSLIERSDQALYHAKHTGRNRAVTYATFQADRALRRQTPVPAAAPPPVARA